MKQSKAMSLVESAINIGVGFGISLAAQIFFLPLLGVAVSLHQNIVFALIMTAISIVRSFTLRRLFEALHIRTPLSPAVLAIAAERRRQHDVEGYDLAHDDRHTMGDLADAAAAYAYTAGSQGPPPPFWPWADDFWKPQDRRRDLVRAGALILAELDRLERLRRRRPPKFADGGTVRGAWPAELAGLRPPLAGETTTRQQP